MRLSKSKPRRLSTLIPIKATARFSLPYIFFVIGFASVAFIFSVSTSFAQTKTEQSNGKEVQAKEVLVKFKAPAANTTLNVEQNEDVDQVDRVGGTDTFLLHSRSKDTTTLVRELSARSDVLYAEPNFVIHADALPNDPSFSKLWGLQNTGQDIGCGLVCFGSASGTPGADISATSAWDISKGSTANVIGIVDTGVDYSHPDLAANIWTAPTAFTVVVGGRTINCAAGTHGFNALSNSCDPMDDNNHGTHVAGTIGAVGNNGVGVTGINWTARIMGAKFLDASGSGTTAGAINAIEFTIQAKAAFAGSSAANMRILSNSWGGGGFSKALLDEINRANSNDMLFVAAAGNSSSNNDVIPAYPASYNTPNIVSVAATDNTDSLAWFSNYGPTSVHLGAPGVDVLSTIIGGSYAYFSGTSMATPHVSGAALLVLSKCSLTTAALKSDLLNNVDHISSLTGLTATGGRLNVNKAIGVCSAPVTSDFSVSTTPASSAVTAGTSTSYTVKADSVGGFTGTVAFTASGLPTGASASFNPLSVVSPGSSTMTVSTNANTTPGNYTLTVTGTSGAIVKTTLVSLTVTAPPPPLDFSLSISPSSATVPATGGRASYTVTITRTGGFNSSVKLSVSGLPTGASASFNPSSTTGTSSTLRIRVNSATAAKSYVFTVTGTGGSPALTRTATATLVKPSISHTGRNQSQGLQLSLSLGLSE